MTGLFVKDIKLLMQRKMTIILFLVISVLLGYTVEGTFVVGYTTFCLFVLAESTISYDEFDNGFSFLMTLPFKRTTYVLEKYVLCGLFAFCAWIFSVIVCIFINDYKHIGVVTSDLLMQSAIIFPCVLLTINLMIPLQFIFGAEKSRVVIIATAGIIFISGWAIKKVADLLDLPIDSVLLKLQKITELQLAIGCVAIAIATTLLSFAISNNIMNNKEF